MIKSNAVTSDSGKLGCDWEAVTPIFGISRPDSTTRIKIHRAKVFECIKKIITEAWAVFFLNNWKPLSPPFKKVGKSRKLQFCWHFAPVELITAHQGKAGTS
jgi:hypothetical protein